MSNKSTIASFAITPAMREDIKEIAGVTGVACSVLYREATQFLINCYRGIDHPALFLRMRPNAQQVINA
ncbi:MAG: hypothetical protein CFE32_16170 [Alphaproteobacteria bacterium PA3]|nr:MAG: hypothetical protein CFE32_16170 [Alphaproteobacteria bacterium PA3]